MRALIPRLSLVVALLGTSAAYGVADLVLFGDAPISAIAGQSMIHEFTIYDVGGDDATDTTFDAVLPAGVTLLGDSQDACGVVSTAADGQQTISCGFGTLPSGDSIDLNLLLLVEHDFLPDRGATSAIYTPVVSTSETETDTSDNEVTLNTLVEASADLKLALFGSASVVPAGEQFTYTIIVENLGPSTAENLIITDTLVTSAFVQANGCSLAVRTDGGLIDQFNCNFALSVGVFDLAVMGSNWLNPRGAPCDWDPGADPGEEELCDDSWEGDMGRIIITINLTAEEELTLQSLTNVFSDTPDPDLENNTATSVHGFEAVADLGVYVVGGSAVNAGEMASWDVTVVNHGPSASDNVRLLDRLPAGLVDGTIQITGNLVEDILGSPIMGPAVSCTTGTPGVPEDPATCDLGGLPEGWGAELTVTGLVDPRYLANHGGLPAPIGLANDFEATSDTWDAAFQDECPTWPCPPAPDEPNFASAVVLVSDSADRSISMFGVGLPVAGGQFHYEFQVANLGPSLSRDTTLRAFLDDGITFLSASVNLEGVPGFQPLPCDITVGSNAMFCPLGDIPLTGAVPILVFVDVMIDPGVPGGTMLTTDADLFLSDTPDPDNGNNSDSVSVIVINNTPDFFTEVFGPGAVDLEGWQIELTPEFSADGYDACVTGVTAIDPGLSDLAELLLLDDDDFGMISLVDGKKVQLYGLKYSEVYIGSNGYLTLVQGDLAHLPDAAIHFDMKRVSGFFSDLDPSQAGQIRWIQSSDRLLVGWLDVPGYNDPDTNTFYVELFFDGRIRWKMFELDDLPGVVGLSDGFGLPDPFFESDFVPPVGDYPLCPVIFADSFESGDWSRWQ